MRDVTGKVSASQKAAAKCASPLAGLSIQTMSIWGAVSIQNLLNSLKDQESLHSSDLEFQYVSVGNLTDSNVSNLFKASFALGIPLILPCASVATDTAGGSIKVLPSTLFPCTCAATIVCGSGSATSSGCTGGKKRQGAGSSSAGSSAGSCGGTGVLSRIYGLGAANGPKGHIGKSHIAGRKALPHFPWRTVITTSAHATAHTWFAARFVRGVAGVQPHHVHIDVIP